jgi:hypothetical protein
MGGLSTEFNRQGIMKRIAGAFLHYSTENIPQSFPGFRDFVRISK